MRTKTEALKRTSKNRVMFYEHFIRESEGTANGMIRNGKREIESESMLMTA